MTKRVTRPKKKAGRKRKEAPPSVPTPLLIEALAADGRDLIGIAAAFGTSTDTFRRWLEESPALDDAFKRGREQERHNLHNKLYKQGMAGVYQCSMFLLKSRHGYREGDQSEAANKVSVTFTLPAAVKPEDFKVIEHEPAAGAISLPAARIKRS
jgi:hypothetical protein